MTLWGGRFDMPPDQALRALNDSLPFDQRMAQQDIRASIAYARALAGAGVIADHERDQIIAGLGQIAAEWAADRFVVAAGDEDIHTAVERRLIELVGAVGGKLHTGRSRNDQVATDTRLWTMDAIDRLDTALRDLQRALVDRADGAVDLLMPGYTHMQPAQPISVGHWLLSYAWMLDRDRDRLSDARKRTAVLPLGAGALAGTPFPIDRAAIAHELGFAAISANSLDAVSDRDFIAEALFTLALIGIHLSRMGEDVILFSNPAFGFLTLDDRYSTGSSLMPQKRNADPMELARGKTGRLIGHVTGVLTTLKGLPTGYNKDLQEDKEPLFDAFETLALLLPVVTAVVRTVILRPQAMQAALSDEMLATDLADYLVARGIPFREAHHHAGRAVKRAVELGVSLSALPLAELQAIAPVFAADVAAVFDFAASAARRSTAGGTAPDSVRAQIAALRVQLG